MIAHPRLVAAQDPERAALLMVDRGVAISYAELVENSDRAARLLMGFGVQEGDTIAILMENNVRYPELIWAAKNSGVRYVCISTHLNGLDAGYVLGDCGAKVLFTSWATRHLAIEAMGESRDLIALMVDGAEAPFLSYEESLVEQSPAPLVGRRRGPSMLYSSGTTGRPKGVKVDIPDAPPESPPARYGMLLAQYGLGADTRFINPGPFYHAGPNRFMISTLRAGGTVLGFEKFDPHATLKAISEQHVTHGFFVPTMFSRMLALPADVRLNANLQSMRHAIHAAAPCPVEVKKAMIEWWGPVIDELYAGTEAFGHTFITSAEWMAHPGSVGRPAAGCALKIVDQNGAPLPPGEPGRIMMRNGHTISYHGDPCKSEALYDSEGYASLGDIGYLDEEGYLYLTDRESHMIVAGGVNIYPQEAEAVLMTHPAVRDIAVIGVPDPDMGEAVLGVVQLESHHVACDRMADELIAYCRERLSLHKCPRRIDFVADLPRNDVGKLVKRALKQRYWEGHGRLI